MNSTQPYLDAIGRILDGDASDTEKLALMATYAGHFRAAHLGGTQAQRHGSRVLAGPFAGMLFPDWAVEGCCMPKLLGCYEEELHGHLYQLASRAYETIVNIGCADGYYAVGLALKFPAAKVLAFDIDQRAQQRCRELADMNGVGARVEVSGALDGEHFARFALRRTLILCDIEGAEADLLDPHRWPALGSFDLVVETHDAAVPGCLARLTRRFAPTHSLDVVYNRPFRTTPMPDWLSGLAQIDQLMAVCEFRAGPTPWLVMRCRELGPMA